MRKSVAQIVAVDLFMNCMGFCFLCLIMVLPFINDPTKPTENATPPGNLMVSIAWPAGNTDVDLWVRAPGDDKAVGYSNKGGKVWNLLRDDLGEINDDEPFNKEDAFSRGLPDGEYVVNLHGYRLAATVPVSVEIGLAQGGVSQLLFKTTMDIRHGQERTVLRFRVKDGRVVAGSQNQVFTPLRAAKK